MIEKYIKMLNINHIINYGKKNNVVISENDAFIILDYIKKYWEELIFSNPIYLFDEIKEKIDPKVYYKLYELYLDAKKKLN